MGKNVSKVYEEIIQKFLKDVAKINNFTTRKNKNQIIIIIPNKDTK